MTAVEISTNAESAGNREEDIMSYVKQEPELWLYKCALFARPENWVINDMSWKYEPELRDAEYISAPTGKLEVFNSWQYLVWLLSTA
jgi:hypothetical protein